MQVQLELYKTTNIYLKKIMNTYIYYKIVKKYNNYNNNN